MTIPCVAVRTIGAGGGSIAWIDKGGLLHVGPQSAGAQPGPVAYGHGGDEPTLTDANLMLGRLESGVLPRRRDGARPQTQPREALAALGGALGLTAEAAALAAVRTADENMANAIRLIAVERGLDPRDFALIAFGGAGPLHARAVAERLDMPTVLVPPHPGLCSALRRGDRPGPGRPRPDLLRALGRASTSRESPRPSASCASDAIAELRRSVDADEPIVAPLGRPALRRPELRARGRRSPTAISTRRWPRAARARSSDEHERQYGFALPGEAIELINLRVTALPRRAAARCVAGAAPSGAAADGAARSWFDADGAGRLPDPPPRGACARGATLAGRR